jgi:hypothetical protein
MIATILSVLWVITWCVLLAAAMIPKFGIWLISNLLYIGMYIEHGLHFLRFKTRTRN